jgi:hypothetical protein
MSLNLENEAAVIEKAVTSVLGQGYRTADISYTDDNDKSDIKIVGTKEMSKLVADAVMTI